MPVTVVETIKSTSCGLQARLFERAQQRLAAKFHCFFDKDFVRLVKVGQRMVFLQRQHQVAAVDLRAGVHAPDDRLVVLQTGELDERVGELALAVPMRWQCTEHTCDDAHALPLCINPARSGTESLM